MEEAAGATAQGPAGGPLAGVRVVEVAMWHAGPGATATLAELGADVIKIEGIGGDQARTSELPTVPARTEGWSSFWDFSNRGKRGVALDLTRPEALNVLDRMVASADVFLTNLRLSTREKLGIHPERLRSINRRLVYVGVTGHGERGPRADEGAFDQIGQAGSGMMHMVRDVEPQPLTLVALDHVAALLTGHTILTGLVRRALTGDGSTLETSLLGAGILFAQPNLVASALVGRAVDNSWPRAELSLLRHSVQVADGWIVGSNHPEDRYWGGFVRAMEMPWLEQDPRFAHETVRNQNRDELRDVCHDVFMTRSRDEWIERFRREGLMYTAVLDFDEALEEPQVRANEYVSEVDHPVYGTVPLVRHPVRVDGQWSAPVLPAPVAVGEHTREVMREQGWKDEQVAAWLREGLLGEPQGVEQA